MTPRLLPFRCQACGEVIELLANTAALHTSCPKRQPGKAAPKYQLVARSAS